jgi:hypothetical protein
MRWEPPGHCDGVTGRCFGDRVILVRVEIDRAAAVQPAQPASELRQEALEVIGAHLIDGDEDDQRRRCLTRCRLALRAGGCRRERERHTAEGDTKSDRSYHHLGEAEYLTSLRGERLGESRRRPQTYYYST